MLTRGVYTALKKSRVDFSHLRSFIVNNLLYKKFAYRNYIEIIHFFTYNKFIKSVYYIRFFLVLKNVYLIWKSEKKRILKICLKYILYKDYTYKIYILNVFFHIYKNVTYI